MKLILFALLLFAVSAGAQTQPGISPNTPYLRVDQTKLVSNGSTVNVFSEVDLYGNGAAAAGQVDTYWRLLASGDWVTNHTGWVTPQTDPTLIANHQANVPGTFGWNTVGPLANGNWCFRSDYRTAAAHIPSGLGLSADSAGPDGSCCVTLPSNVEVACPGGRFEAVTWTQDRSPEVASWTLYWGTTPGARTNAVTGLTPTSQGGIYSASLDVSASPTADIYIAGKAIGLDTSTTIDSNEIARVFVDPVVGSAQGQIVRVRLWNASNPGIDQVIYQDFQSFPTIQNNVRSCVAIEAVPNAYLAGLGPGSINFLIGGVNHCESTPPYSDFSDNGSSQFGCDPNIAPVGAHTLVMTPFDNDGCTGTPSGTPVTINFNTLGP